MPAKYQSAPTMQAHMKIPSTKMAPRSSFRRFPRTLFRRGPCASGKANPSIDIARPLIREDRFGAHGPRGHEETRQLGGERRADDHAREADATGALHSHVYPHLLDGLWAHRVE